MESERQHRIMNLLRELNNAGVRDRRVLTALASVPREAFVSEKLQSQAWDNRALPIDQEQTISQPLIVGLMAQALRLSGDERVLEVGTGSGYQAAIIAELASSVVSIERHPELARTAQERLNSLGYQNVTVVTGDGTEGWPDLAPYDRIIVTAAAPHLPAPLLEQLEQTPGARIVVPIGSTNDQDLVIFERAGDQLRELNLGPVRFVPLIGRHAWRDS